MTTTETSSDGICVDQTGRIAEVARATRCDVAAAVLWMNPSENAQERTPAPNIRGKLALDRRQIIDRVGRAHRAFDLHSSMKSKM